MMAPLNLKIRLKIDAVRSGVILLSSGMEQSFPVAWTPMVSYLWEMPKRGLKKFGIVPNIGNYESES